jgi:flagellar M-ring protein FliF
LPPALLSLLDRIGGPRRAGILGVGLLAAALIFGVTRWATAPTWVPAFTGLPLESVGKMTEQLEGAGVQFRMEQGGSTILVPAADLARARVAMASQGMPAQGRPGLELFDQPSWGMTDFTQRINYRRALEGELERTIGKMRGIESAQVHLALHEQASFRRGQEQPSQASVVLKLKSGQEPAQDVVQGITHLIASSVASLDARRVTVLDDAGRLLTESEADASLAGLTSHQLKVQREVESYLERRAEQLVSQIVGPGNARVQVAAAINFDKVDRTTESVDPERQALSTEQRSEITPGAQGGAASSNTATSYENTRSTETFSGAIGNVRRISVAVLVNNRAAAAAPAPDAAGGDEAAAPAIPAPGAPRTAEELQRIETLVRSAVGADSVRGDAVSVVNVPFDAPAALPAPEAEKPTLVETVQSVQAPVLNAVGLLLVFGVALMVIRSLRADAPRAAAAPPSLAAGDTYAALAAAADPALAASAAAPSAARVAAARPHPKLLMASVSPVREQAVATVEERPELAVRLVRTWLKEG